MRAKKATALLIDNGKVDVLPVQRTLELGGLECVVSDREEALYHIYMSRLDLLVLVSPGDESLPILTAVQVMSEAPTVALVPHPDSPSAEWAREVEVDTWLEIGDEAGLLELVEKLLT